MSSGWLAREGSASQILLQALAFGITRAAVLVGTVATAKAAGVEAYGAIAIALVVFQAGVLLRDAGLGQAVIILGQHTGLAWASFVIVSTIGVCLGGAMWVVSAPISTSLGIPTATEPTRILALAFAIGSIGVVPNAILEGQLKFGWRAVIDLVSYSALLGATLLALREGVGATSIAFGYLVQSSLQSLIALMVAPPWANHRGHPRAIGRLVRYGALLWSSAALSYLGSNADNVIIAALGGSAAVGTYAVFYSVATMTTIAPAQVVNRVALAHYARAAGDAEALGRVLLGALRLTMGLSLVPAVTISLVAPELAVTIAGLHAPAVALSVLSGYGAARSLGIALGTALNGTGLARYGVFGSLLNVSLIVGLLPIGYMVGGILGATVTVLAAMVTALLYIAHRAAPLMGSVTSTVGLYLALILAIPSGGAALASAPLLLRVSLLAVIAVTCLGAVVWIEGRALLRRPVVGDNADRSTQRWQ